MGLGPGPTLSTHLLASPLLGLKRGGGVLSYQKKKKKRRGARLGLKRGG